MMDPEIGALLDHLYEEVETYTTDDGDVFISIHTIDLMAGIIQNSINMSLAQGVEIPEDCMFGVMWVASLYQMLHDTMELKGTTGVVPDSPAELGELDE